MALTDKLSAIADAIREKTKTTEKMTLDRMPELISSITGGGGAAAEYINFYDYDGTLLHQYPLSVFEDMAALPMYPDSRVLVITKVDDPDELLLKWEDYKEKHHIVIKEQISYE